MRKLASIARSNGGRRRHVRRRQNPFWLVPAAVLAAASGMLYLAGKSAYDWYNPPPTPQPPGPTVPKGGNTGAVTDPQAVDKMISESKKKQDAFYADWFSAQPTYLSWPASISAPDGSDPQKKGANDDTMLYLAMVAAGAATYSLMARR